MSKSTTCHTRKNISLKLYFWYVTLWHFCQYIILGPIKHFPSKTEVEIVLKPIPNMNFIIVSCFYNQGLHNVQHMISKISNDIGAPDSTATQVYGTNQAVQYPLYSQLSFLEEIILFTTQWNYIFLEWPFFFSITQWVQFDLILNSMDNSPLTTW